MVWQGKKTDVDDQKVSEVKCDCRRLQGSSGDERAMAKEVSSVIGRKGSEEIVAEGQEPFEFWELLGGKAAYATSRR